MKWIFWCFSSGTALSTSRFISSSVTKANRSAILTLILMWDLNPWSRFWKLWNIIGEYPRIFPSFSWGIFAHVTRLDQSRASENIWWIIMQNIIISIFAIIFDISKISLIHFLQFLMIISWYIIFHKCPWYFDFPTDKLAWHIMIIWK